MLKIKNLYLKNYSGFKDESFFDFTLNNNFNKINVFFGPNGCGKSTGMGAISLLLRAQMFQKRDQQSDNLLLRKHKYHNDYDPSYIGFQKSTSEMVIKGTFSDGEKDYIVEIINDDVVKNELSNRKLDNAILIDADHPLNNNKFQISATQKELFEYLAKSIYGYNCYLCKPVNINGTEKSNENLKRIISAYANLKEENKKNDDKFSIEEIYNTLVSTEDSKDLLFQDFVIEKGDVKVHYKAMSAGEKKIATLLRSLCDPNLVNKSDIILIDNIELHVYFKRHANMIDKILERFSDKQFIVTTHSSVIIEHVANKYGKNCLFDIPVIKNQPLTVE